MHNCLLESAALVFVWLQVGAKRAASYEVRQFIRCRSAPRAVQQIVRDPSKARLRYDMEPTTVELLRIFIADTEEGAPAWSIPEIHVYESVLGSTQD